MNGGNEPAGGMQPEHIVTQGTSPRPRAEPWMEPFPVFILHLHSSQVSKVYRSPRLYSSTAAWAFQKAPRWGALGTTLPNRPSAT